MEQTNTMIATKNFQLIKTVKGSKFLYEIKDENGTVYGTRTSGRDYFGAILTSSDADPLSPGRLPWTNFYGRLDLLIKGVEEKKRLLNEDWYRKQYPGTEFTINIATIKNLI